jgi:hypothetical protein
VILAAQRPCRAYGLCVINRNTTGFALGSAPSHSSLTRADVWQDNPSEQCDEDIR